MRSNVRTSTVARCGEFMNILLTGILEHHASISRMFPRLTDGNERNDKTSLESVYHIRYFDSNSHTARVQLTFLSF